VVYDTKLMALEYLCFLEGFIIGHSMLESVGVVDNVCNGRE